MTEVKNMAEETMPEVIERKNDFCVISKEANENGWHDLQKNSAWSANPDTDYFVIVPDDMVEAIWETCGYCDLELNEDGTEVVAFTPLEIPFIPELEPEPTTDDILNALLGVE